MKINSVIRTIAKKKWGVLAVPLIMLVFFIFFARPVNAGVLATIFDVVGGGISGTLAAMLYPITVILVGLLGLAGRLVNFALQPQPLITSDFVQTGWVAMRDLGNMLFILVLLGIALDYILFNSVGIKRALPRLLFIALLVNFSLPIAGIALDFANIATSFFMDRAGGAHFTETLADHLGLARILDMKTLAAETTVNVSAAVIANGAFFDTVFSIIFLSGTLFVFFALAILFFIRHFYLSVLLILLPLALTISILPFLSSHFKKWTSKFFQWTMFAPACSFFLYLSMVFLNSSQLAIIKTNTAGSSAGWLATMGTQFTTYIFAWGLMLMSLTVAQSMGITGAGIAVATFNKGTKWARGKAGYYGKRGLEKAGVARVMERGAEIAGKAPIVGGFAARGITTGAMRLRGAKEKEAELAKSELEIIEKGSPEAVTNLIQSYQKGTSVQKLKAAKLLALATEKGKFEPRDPATGDLSDTEVLAARQSAYNTARTSGDIKTRRAIEASDHRIREQAVSHKFSNITTTRVNKHGVTEKYDQESGLFESEAEDKIYNDIRPKDIAQLQDSSMPPAQLSSMVGNMMRSKAMTSRHLQEALDERKHAFLAEVKAYIKRTTPAPPAGTIGTPSRPATPTTSAMSATGLYATHPGLASQLERSAGLAEVLLEVTP